MNSQTEQKGSRAGSGKAADGESFHHESLSVKVPGKWFWLLRFTAIQFDEWVSTDSAVKEKKRKEVETEQKCLCAGSCVFTFTQLCEDQELCLSGVWLLLTDGGGRAELNHVGMTRQLFLWSRQVKEHTGKKNTTVVSSLASGQSFQKLKERNPKSSSGDKVGRFTCVLFNLWRKIIGYCRNLQQFKVFYSAIDCDAQPSKPKKEQLLFWGCTVVCWTNSESGKRLWLGDGKNSLVTLDFVFLPRQH